jgi:hypothetical protein
LTVLAAEGAFLTGSIAFTPSAHIEHIEGRPCNLLDDEGVVAEFRLSEHIPNLHVELEAKLRFDVLMEGISFERSQLGNTLDSVGLLVAYTIERFEEAFAAIPTTN